MLAVRCGNYPEAAVLLDQGQASTSLRDDEHRRTAVEWAEHTKPSTSPPVLHRTSRWRQRCEDTDSTFTKLIQLLIYDKNQTKIQNQMLAMTVHDGKLQFCEYVVGKDNSPISSCHPVRQQPLNHPTTAAQKGGP